MKNEPEYARTGVAVAVIPQGKQPGFVVPDDLRARWKLHLGLSSDVLPKVLSEIGQVDIFIHDSEHTYDNMMFEYQTAWRTVRAGGVLLSHDVGWNSAFSDFACQMNRRPVRFYRIGFGGLRR